MHGPMTLIQGGLLVFLAAVIDGVAYVEDAARCMVHPGCLLFADVKGCDLGKELLGVATRFPDWWTMTVTVTAT